MPKTKNILIFTAIAIVFAVIFYIFFLQSSSDEGGLVTTSPEEAMPATVEPTTNYDFSNNKTLVAKDFLSLLLGVRNIKLNDTMLSDPAFLSLRDSSIVLIPDGNEGRPNPFARFGNDIIPVSETPVNSPTLPSTTNNSSVEIIPTQQ